MRVRSARMTHGRALVPMIVVVLVAAAAAWWYFAPQTMPAFLSGALPRSPRAPLLYKWRDANGRLHVTDAPPADRPYETVQYDPNTNVVPSESTKH